MQYLAVIDTNVIVSALLSKHPDASTVQVFHALLTDRITPVYNDEILAECGNVLRRKKFHFPESLIQNILNYFYKYGIYSDRLSTGEELPDPKDLVFYEVCMSKRNEDSMLVTGNMKHFPSKPFIVTPNEMLEIINNNPLKEYFFTEKFRERCVSYESHLSLFHTFLFSSIPEFFYSAVL